EPGIARQIIEKSRASIAIAMQEFAPDGGWNEGPGYWNYATRYNVFYLCALQTALNTDFGLLKTPGLAETGLFRIDTISPTGKLFNFSDCGEVAEGASQMFWLSRVFDKPLYA